MRSECGEWMRPEYSIVGITNSAEYPYVNGLPSLKKAIELAVRYPCLEFNGACTRIKRNFRFRSLENPNGRVSGLSHEWYVFTDGSIVLSRCLRGSRVGVDDWFNTIPEPSKALAHLQTLETELWCLERIALNLGYRDAYRLLFEARSEAKKETNQKSDLEIPTQYIADTKSKIVKALSIFQQH